MSKVEKMQTGRRDGGKKVHRRRSVYILAGPLPMLLLIFLNETYINDIQSRHH